LAAAKAGMAMLSASAALWSDALHSVADALVLAGSAVAARHSQGVPTRAMTWGFHRTTVLAGLLSALVLWLLVSVVVADAWHDVVHPVLPQVPVMALGGSVGLVANALLAKMLGPSADLTGRAAWLHLAADGASSAIVIAAAGVVAWWGWPWADPIGAVLIAVGVAVAAFRVMRDAWRVLMEAVPENIDVARVEAALLEVPGVQDVHHLHVWSVAPGEVALSAHVRVRSGETVAAADAVLRAAHRTMHRRFGIAHTTLQIEGGPGACAEPAHGGHRPDLGEEE
jgi:cobalt-zinc-cadmium efflux system protein